jgi:hypothetical protein
VPGLRGVRAREGGIDAVATAIRWLSRYTTRDFCIKACGDSAAIVAPTPFDAELTVISNTRPETMTPSERYAEVASIFARGLARAIHAERAPASRSTREESELAESDADRIELPQHADLSVSELYCDLEGFSLHAKVAIDGHDRTGLERLCRYITRPAIASERLSIDSDGRVVYRLRRPSSDGTSAIVFEPLAFLERLAALVPRPRAHLLTYHGVLAPAAKLDPIPVP